MFCIRTVCYLRIVEIVIMYKCRLTIRRCKVPIAYAYNNVAISSTARDYFYDNLPHQKSRV